MTIEKIPDGASPLRFLSEGSYTHFHDLEEARKHPDSAMVMEGDYGGQIYLTCPVQKIACSEHALQNLLNDITGLARFEGEQILYELLPVGSGVAGGMGGGVIVDGVWVHDYFEGPFGLAIREVIDGKVDRIWKGSIRFQELYEKEPLLIFAVRIGCRELFDAILRDKRSDSTILYSNNGYTLLHLAVERSDHNPYFTEKLLEIGLDPRAKAFRGAQPIHVAARSGNLDAIKSLLKIGVDINSKDDFDYTPVDFAERFNPENKEGIEWLKAQGGTGHS